jgi:hypothetical protein
VKLKRPSRKIGNNEMMARTGIQGFRRIYPLAWLASVTDDSSARAEPIHLKVHLYSTEPRRPTIPVLSKFNARLLEYWSTLLGHRTTLLLGKADMKYSEYATQHIQETTRVRNLDSRIQARALKAESPPKGAKMIHDASDHGR